MLETRLSKTSPSQISSLPAVVRLEPISRFLFRRVIVVPALAGLSLMAALPALAQSAPAPATSTDSGSLGPVVTVVKPEYSDVLKDTSPIVIAIAPRRYPAQSVEILVDGKSFSGVLPIQNKFNWNTALLDKNGDRIFLDGMHTLTVRVTDTQGFIGQAETRVFINNNAVKTPDTTAPILNWLNLKNGQTLSGEVSVRLNAKDDFGVKYVFLRLNNAITPDEKSQVASWMTNRPPYEFRLDTSKFDDGDYLFSARAWDATQNETNAPAVRVKFFNHGINPVPVGSPPPVDPDAGGSTDVGPGDWVERRHAPPTPVKPPIVTIMGQQRDGAMQSSVSIAAHNSDLMSEHEQSSEQASRPNLGARSSALVVPKTTGTKTIESKSVEPKINASQVSVPPTPKITIPPRIVITPQTRDAHNVAETMVSEANSPALSTPASSRSSVSQSRTSRGAEYSITSPTGLTRVAINPEIPPHVVNGATPASTVVEQLMEAVGASLPHENLGLTRIAAILPDPVSTPPAQTKWVPSGNHSSEHSASTLAQATPVETSSVTTALHVGRGASFDVVIPSVTQRTTAPSTQLPIIKTSVIKTPTVQTVKIPMPKVPIHIPQKSLAPMPVPHAPVKVVTPIKPATPIKVITPVEESTPTQVKPIGAVRSLPTPPRIAMSPDIKPSARTHHTQAAIVVAPEAPLKNASVVATRDETLAAFASRVKMPLEAVAVANAMMTNSSVKRGQNLVVPQAITITYKGQPVTGDVAPLLIGSTSVTPFRFMFEQQGGKIIWNENKKQVTAKSDKYEVTITVGSDKALVNQKEQLMDMAAFLLSGRTMVPTRFFETALHASVEWEPSTGRLYVASLP